MQGERIGRNRSRSVQLRPRQGREADYALAVRSLYGPAVSGSEVREVSGVVEP